MENTMKNAMNGTIAALTAAATLVVGAYVASADTGAASVVSQQWRFATGANPAAPDAASGGAAGSLASIAPGPFASPWIASSPGFGSVQGVWDLGKNGAITLQNPAGLEVPSGEARYVTVRVVQYQDGGIFDQLTRVSVPGATQIGTRTSQVSTTLLGEWVVAETQWRVEVGEVVSAISITGVPDGTLVDDVSITASLASGVTGPQLTIRRDGSNVAISWTANGASAVLESNTDPADPHGWSAVTEPVQSNGDLRSVTTGASSTVRFYRLKF